MMAPIIMGLANLAPGIVRMLAGDKAGTVTEQVVGLAQTITGTSSGAQALHALQTNPEKQMEFQIAIGNLELEAEKARLADVANARAMQQVALGQDDLFSKRFVYIFAAAWSLFAMGYFVAVTFLPMSATGQRIADTILGVLITTVLGAMVSYFYGSTKGSAEKTRMIAASAPKG